MRQLESLFWGAIAAMGALVFEMFVYILLNLKPESTTTDVSAFLALPQILILAVIIEESFKYLIIAKRIEYLSQEKTYIINSLLVGTGFFTVELAMMYYQGINLNANLTSLLEILIIHATTAGIIGYRIAVGNPKKLRTFLTTILTVTLIHGGYNFLIQNRTYFVSYLIVSFLVFLVIQTVFNLMRISKHLAA
jgi:hypothetical protein